MINAHGFLDSGEIHADDDGTLIFTLSPNDIGKSPEEIARIIAETGVAINPETLGWYSAPAED